jgi:hypothetical protein
MSGFKLRSGNKSPFKMMGSSTPAASPLKIDTFKKGAERAGWYDMDLNQLTKERKKHAKGSNERNAIQNQINKFMNSDVRHGETETTTKGKRGKSTTTKHTPGIDTEVREEKKGKKGRRKTKTTTTSHVGNDAGEREVTKTRSGKEDKKGRQRTSYKSKDYRADGTLDMTYKDKTKKDGSGRSVYKGKDKKGRTDYKAVDKWDKDGNLLKDKVVVKRRGTGRREVEKWDKKTGTVTTTDRRTLKGILTGKGKGKKTKKVEKYDENKHDVGE